MSMIDQIIDFNKSFVAQKGYEKYLTDKYPDKKLAVLSCMDTRLTELLPAALGLKNGDAKIISIDLDQWLEGFKDTPTSVRKTVETIKTHPLVPKDIVVRGFIIDSETGALEEIG